MVGWGIDWNGIEQDFPLGREGPFITHLKRPGSACLGWIRERRARVGTQSSEMAHSRGKIG